MISERWRPVVGREGAYEVSDAGRVRSLDAVIVRSDGRRHTVTGRILQQLVKPSDPYPTVMIGNGPGTRPTRQRVHNLVLAAFVGPRPNGLIACHENDTPTDNRLANLSWGSYSANLDDAYRNGGRRRPKSCQRGHRLVEANRRNRGCRSCAAGRQSVRDGRATSVQEASDAFYTRITGEAR
jgi:hypothetical protein